MEMNEITFRGYLRDRCLFLAVHIFGMFLLTLYLHLLLIEDAAILLILVCWLTGMVVSMVIGFVRRRQYYEKLLDTAHCLEQKYCMADVINDPQTMEDKVYHYLLYLGNKAMLDEVSSVRHERDEYKEYIEQWVHEVKTPLAAMKLIVENQQPDSKGKLLMELEQANGYVEQVLYYARSENAWKDYMIKEVSLDEIVRKAVIKHKCMFREKNIQIEIQCDDMVYTDSKWIIFVLEQCMMNSVQYNSTKLKFCSQRTGTKTVLTMADDGIGIEPSDLSRVFEKGFTGTNGRASENSTGLGLYLCKRLCDQLDVSIQADSVLKCGTTISLTFAAGRNEKR